MGLYTFICHICGYEFENLKPVGARDYSTCPRCSCRADKKLSLFNFTFGFRFSDESMWVKGHKDEFVRNV